MAFTKKEILDYLQTHEISYTLYEHAPVMTVEEGLSVVSSLNIPGIMIKNLFLKDDHNTYTLVSANADTRIQLKKLSKSLNRKNLRFAQPEILNDRLGVQPGSVTPLALINDQNKQVDFVLDTDILQQKYIQIHPLQNDATIVVTPQDLLQFLSLINKQYLTHDFTQV